MDEQDSFVVETPAPAMGQKRGGRRRQVRTNLSRSGLAWENPFTESEGRRAEVGFLEEMSGCEPGESSGHYGSQGTEIEKRQSSIWHWSLERDKRQGKRLLNNNFG